MSVCVINKIGLHVRAGQGATKTEGGSNGEERRIAEDREDGSDNAGRRKRGQEVAKENGDTDGTGNGDVGKIDVFSRCAVTSVEKVEAFLKKCAEGCRNCTTKLRKQKAETWRARAKHGRDAPMHCQ